MTGFWAYTEETPFHGFGFVSKGWGKCGIFAWLVAVSICIAIAIQQTIALVQIYQAEPTVTEVSAAFNDSFILPNPTLCIDISYSNFQTPDSKAWIIGMANSGGNINSFLAKLQNYTGSQIANDTNAKDLLKLMYLMFADITKKDEYFINPGLLAPQTWDSQTSAQTHKYLMNSNRSFSDLLKLTTSMLCKLLTVQVSFSCVNRTSYSMMIKQFDVCQTDHITHLDSQLICMKVLGNGEQIVYGWPDDSLSISFDSEKWNPDNGSSLQYTLDFSSRAYKNKYSDSSNIYKQQFHTDTKVSIQMLNQFNRLNLKRRPCGQIYNSFDCGRLCGGHYIEGYCGCWPLYFFDLKPQNSTFCAASFNNLNNSTLMPDYHVCLAAMNLKKAIQMPPECAKACPVECHYQQFMFFTDSSTPFTGSSSTAISTQQQQQSQQQPQQLQPNQSQPLQQPNQTQLLQQSQSQPQVQQQSQPQQLPQNQSQSQMQQQNQTQQQRPQLQQQTGTTRIAISIRDFTFTQVAESVVKDWQSFMNEFGGSIGVWLGGSILALVHLPVYFAKMVVTKMMSKKAKPKPAIKGNEIYTTTNPTHVPITF